MKIAPTFSEFKQMAQAGNLILVYHKFLADTETPVSAYLKLKDNSYSYLIESADGRYGVERFVTSMSHCGICGSIMPDLPPQASREYLDEMNAHNLAPILIYSPSASPDRMRFIASFARGFIYCIAREGVTGENTDFSEVLATYLRRCRKSTSLPLALGFGIKEKSHIDFLEGKADIAVIGSQTIRVMEQKGVAAVQNFIRSLR